MTFAHQAGDKGAVAAAEADLAGRHPAALTDLAHRIVSGGLDLEEVAGMDDEEVIARLSEVRGIGRWTAQMFLMFRLGRLNVWPAGDLGVRRGYAVVWGLVEAPTAIALEELGEEFRPWRSVAAWYCWRAVDTVTPLAPVVAEPTEATRLA